MTYQIKIFTKDRGSIKYFEEQVNQWLKHKDQEFILIDTIQYINSEESGDKVIITYRRN